MAASATNMKTKKTFGQWFKSKKGSAMAGNCIIYDYACAVTSCFSYFRLPKCLNLVYIR